MWPAKCDQWKPAINVCCLKLLVLRKWFKATMDMLVELLQQEDAAEHGVFWISGHFLYEKVVEVNDIYFWIIGITHVISCHYHLLLNKWIYQILNYVKAGAKILSEVPTPGYSAVQSTVQSPVCVESAVTVFLKSSYQTLKSISNRRKWECKLRK